VFVYAHHSTLFSSSLDCISIQLHLLENWLLVQYIHSLYISRESLKRMMGCMSPVLDSSQCRSLVSHTPLVVLVHDMKFPVQLSRELLCCVSPSCMAHSDRLCTNSCSTKKSFCTWGIHSVLTFKFRYHPCQ